MREPGDPSEQPAPQRPGGPARASWTRADTIASSLVVVAAGAVRLVRATVPSGGVFDEGHYVTDACIAVLSGGPCEDAGGFASGHPPLGSWLIGVGIKALGYRTGGWRAVPLLAGTLTVALLYVLARRMLGSTVGATLAAGLLSVDFLHVVHSRTAMLDVFVTLFAVAGALFVVLDAGSPGSRWRYAAGLAAGAAAATKWSGVPILAGLLALAVLFEARRVRAIPAVVRARWTSLALSFIAIPALVYVASHIGRLDGTVLAMPWSEHSWVRAFLTRQGEMFDLQASLGGLGAQNPYTSPAWSWPLLARPVVYHFTTEGGSYREIIALGNPLIWWASVPAIAYGAARWVRSRFEPGADAVIVVGFATAWLPWLVLSGTRSYTFLFYLLPGVPFMCLALARAVVALPRARAVATLTIGGAIALFVFFYPVLTAMRVSPHAWEARTWFSYASCRLEPAPPGVAPNAELVERRTPPEGWCWI